MALAMLFVFFLLRVLLRREWAAAVYGFYTSLGGQSPFGRVSLED